MATGSLSSAVGSLYVTKHFDETSKATALDMVEDIGYPSELLDMKKLTDLYKGLELSSEDFLGNGLNMTIFSQNYSFEKLREKVNKTDWVRHGNPAVANA